MALRRLVTIQHANGQLSGEVSSVETEDAPLRMALGSNSLALALGRGGLQRFDLRRSAEGPPALSPPPGGCTLSTPTV